MKDKIENKNFEEFKRTTLSSQPEQKQKVIKMILDEIEDLNFQKVSQEFMLSIQIM